MRRLRQPHLLALSIPVGMGLALACVPLILQAGGEADSARGLQVAVLPVLCVLILQAVLAWTPEEARRVPVIEPPRLAPGWLELLLLALAVAAFRFLTDRWLQRVLVLPTVADGWDFLRMLPFTGLVQPLFLVLGVYAFTLRLGGRPRLALAAVVVAHQAIVLLQFGPLADRLVQAALLLLAGVQGLVMGGAYRRYGPAGPALLSVVGFGRHALYLAFPVLRGAALT